MELARHRAHILLLDGPTNHLDVETIEAMAMSLTRLEGGTLGHDFRSSMNDEGFERHSQEVGTAVMEHDGT